MGGPSRKQLWIYYFLFSYVYFITNYCYVSLPPAWILRKNNLTPHVSRMIDFRLFSIFRVHWVSRAREGRQMRVQAHDTVMLS